MLNDYQAQFIHALDREGARYLIIGGMARLHHLGKPTRDLDLLVDITHSRQAIERVLCGWKRAHPAHTLAAMEPPLPLRPKLQFKFPDEICLYRDGGNEIAEIAPADGIDVLTSVDGCEFDDLFQRSVVAVHGGLSLRFIGSADLDTVSPPKATTGHV